MSKELQSLGRQVAMGKLSRRDFLGRAAALGVSAPFATAILSQTAQAAEEPVRGGTLRIAADGGESTNTLDPALTASLVPQLNGRAFGDTLFEVAPNGDLQYRLATEMSSDETAKVWTAKIRQGVKFHDGKALTAEDVVATMQRHSGEDSKSGALGIMKGIASVEADGENVIFTLNDANADLPYLLSDYHLIIQPNGGLDNPAAGIGTGPYKLVSDEPGVRHVWERNEDDWDGANRGYADRVEIIVINDGTARLAALQSGQAHMISRVEPKVIDLVRRLPNVNIQNVAGRGHYVFIMHCDTAPFDNNDLRLALKYAIDREEMVEKVLKGMGSVGNDMPINSAYPLFSDDIEQRTFDPEKAAEHYKKSGHTGPVVLRVADGAFPGAVDAAQLFQASAKKCGIDLEIKREPNDGYWSEVWNKQPFCASYWGGRPVQDQMYTTAYLSTADWNDTRFKRDDFDALIKSARTELDEGKRKEIYKQAGMMVRDEGGLICPMFNEFVDATNNKVGGFVGDPSGAMMNSYASSKCWVKA